MTKESSRIDWIDAARGVAVLAVVAFHLTIWYYPQFRIEGSTADGIWSLSNQVLTTLRMPLLLMVSGMLASGRISEGIHSKRVHLASIKNYYLYVVWLAIYALLWIPVTVEQMPDKPASTSALLLQLVAPDTPLWFIFALMLYMLFFALIRKLPKFPVLAGLALLSVLVGLVPASEPQWYKVLEFAIYFALGLHFKNKVIQGATSRPWLWVLVGGTVVVLASLAAAILEQDLTKSAMFLVRSASTGAMAIGGIVLVCRLRPLRRTLCWIGSRTLGIYVLHPLAITGLILFVHPPTITPWLSVVGMVILIPTVMVVCVIVESGLKKIGAGFLFEMPTRYESPVNLGR